MSIDLVIQSAGSPSELARRMGVSLQRVSNWRERGIPADQVLNIARAVNFKVTPHQIAPDIYPYPLDGIPPRVDAA